MRRANYRSLFLLVITFLTLLCIPKEATDKMRFVAISSVAPTWKMMNHLRNYLAFSSSLSPYAEKKVQQEMQRLQVENQMLRSQIENIQEWILFEDRLEEQVSQFKKIANTKEEHPSKEFFQRRNEELANRFILQMQALPAEVIFRDPSSWSSTIWLNVGEKDNELLGKSVVAKNSPVVVGDSIIGVVEFVAAKKSMVRLITDTSLAPSVRALRGGEQNRFLLEEIEKVYRVLEKRLDLFDSKTREKQVFEGLHFLKEKLSQAKKDEFLAKGELYGTSTPLWRCHTSTLKGSGFNYDFSDEEGPARDLRTGEATNIKNAEPVALLQVGDLLVTTGFDGVFPAGYRVATVTSIGSLREGGCSYEIEATATAGNLRELHHVFVLPPLSSGSE